MKSPRILSTLPLFLFGLTVIVQGQNCLSGHLYCGYALENIGEATRTISVHALDFLTASRTAGWSKNDLIVTVTNDPDPSQGAIDHPGQALYQCLDSEEEVFYVGYCNQGCDAMDDDSDDICNGE